MMIMVMLGCSVSAGAVTKNNADTEYQKGSGKIQETESRSIQGIHQSEDDTGDG